MFHFQDFRDINIKSFINIERMEAIRLYRKQRRFESEYLWGKTSQGHDRASMMDFECEDPFNLRDLFKINEEGDSI